MNPNIRHNPGKSTQAIPVHEAVENSPTLGHLTALIQDSSARLKAIESLIPASALCREGRAHRRRELVPFGQWKRSCRKTQATHAADPVATS